MTETPVEETKNFGAAVIGIREVATAISLAIAAFAIYAISWHFDDILSRDAISYLRTAEGSEPGFLFLPVFIWSEMYRHGLDPAYWGIVLNMAAVAAAGGLLFLLALKLFRSFSVALAGGLLFVFNPLVMRYSFELQREPLLLFFQVAALAGIIGGLSHRLAWWLVGGICTAAAFLCRFEGIECLVFAMIWLAWSWLRPKETQQRRKIVLDAVVFVAAFCLSLSLYCLAAGLPVVELLLKIAGKAKGMG